MDSREFLYVKGKDFYEPACADFQSFTPIPQV